MAPRRKSDDLASHADRDEATSLLRRHHAEGRLTDDDLERRLQVVRSAKTVGDLEVVHEGLPKLGFERSDAAEHRLASDADREKAMTKLRQHHEEGRLDESELARRMGRATSAGTQAEIELLFRDLPSLAPASTPRGSGNLHKRADDDQRDAAIALLRKHKDAGRLSQPELDARAQRASTAETVAVLEELLGDLPKLGPGGAVLERFGTGRGTVRASDDDRADAVRKLRMHGEQGHFATETTDECARRIAIVEAATTPDEIARVFSDLPPLSPLRPHPRRIGNDDRDSAISQLNDHLANGRIDVDEHRARIDQVRSARERSELNAAFRGLPRPGATEMRNSASEVATEGARIAKRTLKVVALTGASAVLFVVIVVIVLVGLLVAAIA